MEILKFPAEKINFLFLPTITNNACRFNFYPELCLPPDEITLELSKMGTNLINQEGEYKEILDLGTGSGIFATYVLLNCRRENIHVTATDIDPLALEIAEGNLDNAAKNRGCSHKSFSLLQTSWLRNLSLHRKGKYDFIFSNPPFLPKGTELLPEFTSSPMHTMFAEKQGFAHYDTIFKEIMQHLTPKGSALVRIPYAQYNLGPILNILTRYAARAKFDILEVKAQERKGKALLIDK